MEATYLDLLKAVIALTGDSKTLAARNIRRMNNLLRSGLVERWHTYGRALQQNIGEHSWSVALLVILLKPDASAELLRAAILHDVHEVVFGDVPSPTKAKHAIISEIEDETERDFWRTNLLEPITLTTNEQRLLKACDKLEALFFIHRNNGHDMSFLSERIVQTILAITEETDDV
jgi:5'-deoxynucleotidase YfbR-like HD superfamily hydrolase